jgi:cyclase
MGPAGFPRRMAPSRPATSAHYEFHEIAPGVTFGHARPDGFALSNTGIVDLGGSTLVFDTSVSLAAARDLAAACESRTGRRASLAVNSHWHLDHILGNQLFADRPIFSTQRTVEILLEKRAELAAELTKEKLAADIRELEERAKAATDAGRAELEPIIRLNRSVLEEAVELRLTVPTDTYEGELQLPGDRKARLVSFGAGHTDSDTLLYLSDCRTVFAGDLVVADSHPNLGSGDPAHWITVLDRIRDLKPEWVATGHGPLGNLETVAGVRDYLSAIFELAREEGTPEIPARFREWRGADMFEGNLKTVRSLPRARYEGIA